MHQEGGETVIGTERFKSRIMQVNLRAVRRAPYDASMGAKTYHMSESDRLHSTDDLMGWLTTMPVMGEVVEKAVEAGVRDKVKIMIGGAPVTEAFGQTINADAYTPDATTCAEVAMQLLAS